MYIDDEKARKLMIEILYINDDPEGIKALDDWIEKSGIEKVYEKNMDILIGMIMDEEMVKEVNIRMRYANKN